MQNHYRSFVHFWRYKRKGGLFVGNMHPRIKKKKKENTTSVFKKKWSTTVV